ncbi:MAG: tetratricopeptide repeat protein, partial [Acidobacteria bacterium]|nr:tetratricopeptide repeat protein [Acidobacteriota bacterium]
DLETAVAQQIREAQGRLEASLRATPPNRAELAERYGFLAQLYHTYGLLHCAAPAYRNAIRLAPGDTRWIYYLASVDRQQGNLEAALTEYRKLAEVEPKNLAAHYRQAEVLRDLGRLDEAETEITAVLQGSSSSPAALALYGEIELALEKPKQAADALELALAQVPEANRLHFLLFQAYRALGDEDQARAHLEQRGTVGVKPPDQLMDELESLREGELVHVLSGRMAFAAGRYEEAAQEFAKAVNAAPESARSRVNLAAALVQLGQANEAASQLTKAIELEPDNSTARFNLAQVLAWGGDDAGAEDQLTKVVELDPEDVAAQTELAKLLRKRGEWDEALTHYDKALEVQRMNEAARLGQAVVLTELGRYREAIDSLDSALRQQPGQGRWAHALARLLAGVPDLELRDGPRAVSLAQAVFAAQPSADHAETLAMAQAENGDCAAAAKTQEQAIELAQEKKSASDEGFSEETAQGMDEALDRYRRSNPCRPPR